MKSLINSINGYKSEYSKNAGFSLIELLVAVVILAIIFTPILKSFTTASQVNSKAQMKQAATSLAEYYMEETKSMTRDQLKEKSGSDSAPYTINYDDVSVTKNRLCDVEVNVTTDEYSNSDRNDERNDNKKNSVDDFGDVSDANMVPIPKFSDIDSSQNAVISWEINEYDGSAFESLLDKNVEDTTGNYWDNKSWWGGIRNTLGTGSKTVTVDITQSGNEIDVKAKAIYDANATGYVPITYTIYHSTFDKDKMEDIYVFYTIMMDDAETRKRQLSAEESSNFYMFYVGKENLIINDSTSGADFRIFLIVQKVVSDFELTGINNADKTVEIKGKKGGEYTSLKIHNISSDSNGFTVNNHKVFTNFTYTTAEDGKLVWMPDSLFETETKNKLYNVTVDVKDKDGGVLATLTSTMPADE